MRFLVKSRRLSLSKPTVTTLTMIYLFGGRIYFQVYYPTPAMQARSYSIIVTITIRPAHLPAEYTAIAAVLAAESPGWSATVEELAHNDASRDPALYHATLVALAATVDRPCMIGAAFVGHEPLTHQPGKFEINLRVRPEWQGHGVGKALYAALLDHLAPFAPQELVAVVWHGVERAIRFLSERGFVEAWRRIDWVLDVTAFDFAPYHRLAEQLPIINNQSPIANEK